MIRKVVLALIMVVSLSAPSWGQSRPDQNHGSDPGPIGRLLEMRVALNLSEAQILRLSEIEAEVDSLNRPHVEQITEIRRRMVSLGLLSQPRYRLSGEQRLQYDADMAELRPLAKRIEKNAHTAMQQVGTVLTDVQSTELWRVLRQQDRSRDRNGDSQRPPSRRN